MRAVSNKVLWFPPFLDQNNSNQASRSILIPYQSYADRKFEIWLTKASFKYLVLEKNFPGCLLELLSVLWVDIPSFFFFFLLLLLSSFFLPLYSNHLCSCSYYFCLLTMITIRSFLPTKEGYLLFLSNYHQITLSKTLRSIDLPLSHYSSRCYFISDI